MSDDFYAGGQCFCDKLACKKSQELFREIEQLHNERSADGLICGRTFKNGEVSPPALSLWQFKE